jgi:tRNA(Ile)-lysidine synthase
MLLVARVRRTLIDRAMLPSGARVIVAVSGGPDSTALLDVLARLAGERSFAVVAAVGVDHGLRPEAGSELDGAEAHARRIGVPFDRIGVTVGPRGSVAAAAREARYAALAEARIRWGATHVAVGHTQDDQAETVLARVLHGSGLRGLAGVDPARDDGVVRPLVDASRAAVLAYLADAGLGFATDPSNADPRFDRARIRSTVLPALTAESTEAAAHLAALADEARETEDTLEALAAALLADAAVPGSALSLSRLRRAPVAVALRALRRALGPEIGRAHLTELRRWLQEDVTGGTLRLPGARTARIVGDRLEVTPLGRPAPDEEA